MASYLKRYLNVGIGYETARALARKNAHVVIASKTKERGEKAAQEIREEASAEAKIDCMQMDLASFRYNVLDLPLIESAIRFASLTTDYVLDRCPACSSIRSFADEYKARKYPLHVLVNNAGVFIPPTDRTEEDFEVTLGINHFGPFYLTHLLLNNLEQSAPSRIVNLG